MHTNSIVGCHKNNLAPRGVEDIKLPTIVLQLLLYFKGFHTVIKNYQCDLSFKESVDSIHAYIKISWSEIYTVHLYRVY